VAGDDIEPGLAERCRPAVARCVEVTAARDEGNRPLHAVAPDRVMGRRAANRVRPTCRGALRRAIRPRKRAAEGNLIHDNHSSWSRFDRDLDSPAGIALRHQPV
jgi:hypothetical protein